MRRRCASTEMVSVQSDPERSSSKKGFVGALIGESETLRKEAMSELKNEVLKAASHELVRRSPCEAQALEQFSGC